jgi:hypothetical protein
LCLASDGKGLGLLAARRGTTSATVAGMSHSTSRAMLLVALIVSGCSGNSLGVGGGGSGGSAGGGGGVGGGIPTMHRPVPMTCPPVVGNCPARTTDMGTMGCASDQDCTTSPHGHCDVMFNGCSCDYDTCLGDSDCPANNICACASPRGEPANVCVPGNCRVDADCGPGGYCSLSLGMGCIGRLPVQGAFCHSKADTCTNDADCMSSTGGFNYCQWHPELGHWACTMIVCAG